jgi:hypothetical protein
LDWPTVCWAAAVVILALTFRLRPLLSVRNLDALVLAGACLLLALRGTPGGPRYSSFSWQWCAYAGLTAVVVYWLLRGMGLLLCSGPMQHAGTVSNGARFVLLAVALAISIHRIATAPLTADSRDGIVGGLYTAATGKLPYGAGTEFGSRSPLLYLLHAGAIRIAPPTLMPADEELNRPMNWDNRQWWLVQPWEQTANLTAARLVNAGLFVAMLLGLLLIGMRWQAAGSGWTMLAIFGVFPGTLECLAHPEIMLPATLLTWTFAFALVPGIGGFLAALGAIMAGIAWPWLWLTLPAVLAYFWRRGWQALGGTVGLAAGVAVCVAGLAALVQPALPRADGALRMAGLQPLYSARLVNPETLVLDRREVPSEEIASPALSGRVWRFLVESESASLKSLEQEQHAVKVDWPNGISASAVLYRQIDVPPAALPALQPAYRDALAQMSDPTRLLVAARTVLEATWVPAHAEKPEVTGAWQLWGGPGLATGRWLLIRRIVKGVVALLVIWAFLAVFVGRRVRPRQLLGTLLMATSGALLASAEGAVANWVCLVPLVTALWAVHEPAAPPRAPAPQPAAPRPVAPLPFKPPPRITLEPTSAPPPP